MIYTGGTINESVLIPDIDSLVYPSNPWNPADSDKEVKILTSSHFDEGFNGRGYWRSVRFNKYNGAIYLAGTYVWKKLSWQNKFYKVLGIPSGTRITNMTITDNGNVYVSTRDGIYVQYGGLGDLIKITSGTLDFFYIASYGNNVYAGNNIETGTYYSSGGSFSKISNDEQAAPMISTNLGILCNHLGLKSLVSGTSFVNLKVILKQSNGSNKTYNVGASSVCFGIGYDIYGFFASYDGNNGLYKLNGDTFQLLFNYTNPVKLNGPGSSGDYKYYNGNIYIATYPGLEKESGYGNVNEYSFSKFNISSQEWSWINFLNDDTEYITSGFTSITQNELTGFVYATNSSYVGIYY